MKYRKLTLIELIIVVMVLGLLVGLAIPQFTGVKANADVASFKNDIDVLTKAIDESYVKEDSLPIGGAVTVTDPNLLDAIYASGDSGENLFKVDLAKTERYHSKLKTKVTSENYFIYSSETGKVFYTKGQVDGEGQVLYSLEYTGLSSAMLGLNPLKNGVSVPVSEPVQTITGTVPVDATVKVSVNGTDTPVVVEDAVFDGNMDLMAAVKMKTFTSSVTLAEGKNVVAIKVNSAVTNFNIYLGAQDSGGQPTPTPVIKPKAVISMTPEEALTTATSITWSYAGSTTEVGRTITAAEWEGNQNIYVTEGSYTVRLRVQDSAGVWSDWIEKNILVEKAKAFTFDSNNFILSSNTSKTGNVFTVNDCYSYIKFGDKVTSGVYYMEFTTKSGPYGLIGVSQIFNQYDYIWWNRGAQSLYSNGWLYTGNGSSTTSQNISMPHSLNSVIGIKLDMGNKQVTYYVGTKTFTAPLTSSEYQFYATSGSSYTPYSFTINTDPNTFVYDHGINF